MLARLIPIALLVALGTSGYQSGRGASGGRAGSGGWGGISGVGAAVATAGGNGLGRLGLADRLRLVAGVVGGAGGTIACSGDDAICLKRRARLAELTGLVRDGEAASGRVAGEGEVEAGGDVSAGDEADREPEQQQQQQQEDGDDGSAVEEGRGKKKKKGYGKMMMILGGLTKAVMLYVMIHAVAMLAGKALIVAKVALAIATALALKKSSDHKTSYEIVKHPHYSSSHVHSSSVDYDHGGGGGGGGGGSYEGGSRRRRRARR